MAQSINLLKTIKVTLVKVRDIQLITKNWPEIEFVKVSDDFIVKQKCQGIGWASAFQSRYHRNLMSLEIYQGTARGQLKPPPTFLLTARQYGEVVLPDEASGQSPGTRGRPESCHGARRVWHAFLPSGYKFYRNAGAIAVQF